jgi:hypothetical protein
MVILTLCDWDRYMCDLRGSKIFHCDSVDSRSRGDIEWNAHLALGKKILKISKNRQHNGQKDKTICNTYTLSPFKIVFIYN